MAVSMVMTITNGWKRFGCGVEQDHYGKPIGMREFSELLAPDCFNNPFSTDNGTLGKNISPLEEDNEVETFYT